MHPDGTSSSPEAVPESTMDVASTGTPSEMPVLRVDPRGLGRGRGRGRDPQANAGGHAFSTSERPTRAKKNYRPAQVVFDYSIQRRTPEQMKADQAKDKAEAAAAKAAALAHQKIQKDRVAALEDAQQVEEHTRSLEELRPDLHIDHKSASNTDVETLSDSHLALNNPITLPRVPLIDLPSDHSSYRESSHTEDFLTGWGEVENDVTTGADENKEDQGQDYVMLSDNEDESEASEASEALHEHRKSGPPGPRPKAKFKPQYKRGEFRAAVNEARLVPTRAPPSEIVKKRKAPEQPPPAHDSTSTKRTKPSDPGGLVANWRQKTDLLSHIARKNPIEFIEDEDDFVEGEFDRVEGLDMLSAVRASKPSTVRISTTSTGAKITPRPIIRNPNSTRPKQKKAIVDELPFPYPRAPYITKWKRVFRPTVLSWASTFPDPYATNTKLNETVVLEMWDIIYPDIDLDEEGRRDTGAKLVYLAGHILHDWRTAIGTVALSCVKTHFLNPANQFYKERIVRFVRWGLGPKFNFIYGAPGAEENLKQSFRSELILNVYAKHLRKVSGAAVTYGEQYRALALCAAATERALGFWASGEDMSVRTEEDGRQKLAATFCEMEWGRKACGWAQATIRLNSEQWNSITSEAAVRGKMLPQDEANGGEDNLGVDPHAELEL